MLALIPAVLGALIPTAFYILFVWWLDRYEKEPLWLLALAFLWGAVPAALLSIPVELAAEVVIAHLGEGMLAANLVSVGLGAPVIEESFKGIALIGLVLVFYNEFDGVLDGIIYGAMIGFGFAFTENCLAYFGPVLAGEGVTTEPAGVFLRSVVFGANHAFWTGIIGASVGYARLALDWRRRLLAPVVGWALAVVLHAAHNLAMSMPEEALCLPLGISVMVGWGGILLLLLVAASAVRRECDWIERGLEEEVRRGALTQQEFDLLRSPVERLWVQWQAYRQGGRAASRSVGRYYHAATELAFQKRHLRSREEADRNLEIEPLQAELATYRARAWPWLQPTPN